MFVIYLHLFQNCQGSASWLHLGFHDTLTPQRGIYFECLCALVTFSVTFFRVFARLHISVSVCLFHPLIICVCVSCVCVYLQPNGSGQNKLPGSFLLPPPPVARPVPMPLPLPEHKPCHTHPDSGVGSPASPCKCPLKAPDPPEPSKPPHTPLKNNQNSGF